MTTQNQSTEVVDEVIVDESLTPTQLVVKSVKKNLTMSDFHDIASSKKIEVSFIPNSNSVKFLVPAKSTESTEETAQEISGQYVETDMIKAMKFYVRVNMNVQLLNYDIIDLIVDEMNKVISGYISEFNLDSDLCTDSEETLISFNGPTYASMKGKQITMWVNVDIPYISGHVDKVNECINKITTIYRNYCANCNITGNDVFYIAKFLVKSFLKYTDTSFSTLLVANYQKPNMYVQNAEIHLNVPSDINIGLKDFSGFQNCKVMVLKGKSVLCNETIFDDRVRFYEVIMQRFVEKGMKFVVPHYASRSINISKKDKTKPLIKYENGSIRVNTIGIHISEHPKTTSVLSESITTFLTTNSTLSNKVVKNVSNLFGKNTIGKLTSVYN